MVIEKDKVSFLEGERVDVRVILGFGSMFGGLYYLECHMMIFIFFLKGEKMLFYRSVLWQNFNSEV